MHFLDKGTKLSIVTLETVGSFSELSIVPCKLSTVFIDLAGRLHDRFVIFYNQKLDA